MRVLLLHGRSLSPAMWAPQVHALGGEAEIVAPSFPGVDGEPLPKPARELLASDYADAVEHHVGSGPTVVVGFSLGALVALELAHRNPGAVGALVFVGARLEPDTVEGRQARLEAIDALEAGTAPPVDESWPGALLGPNPSPAAHSQATAVLDPDRDGAIAASAAVAYRRDPTPLLAGIDVATFILHGADDQIVPVDVAERLRARLPQAAFEIVPGAGHLVGLEAPEALTNLIRRALTACTSP